MIISKDDEGYLVKVFKEYLPCNFDIFDKESIVLVFRDILVKLKEKYQIRGVIEIDAYVQEEYGMILEIRETCPYYEEMDVHIHFHLDAVFLTEIDMEDIAKRQEVYYYKDRFYSIYSKVCDCSIIYKDCDDILEHAIRIH